MPQGLRIAVISHEIDDFEHSGYLLVRRDSGLHGPVVVKTDMDHGGMRGKTYPDDRVAWPPKACRIFASSFEA